MQSFDFRNLLLLGAGSSIIAAIGLYFAYRKHYQESMKCYTESPGLTSNTHCTKNISNSIISSNIPLDKSKEQCQENEDILGMDWDATGCRFYQRKSDDKEAGGKCQKSLSKTEGQGQFIACVKIPDRNRGYFIAAIVLAVVSVILLLTWLFIPRQ